MNFRQLQFIKVSLQLIDILLIWLSFFIAIKLRLIWLVFIERYLGKWLQISEFSTQAGDEIGLGNSWASYTLIIIGMPVILSSFGFYRNLLKPDFFKIIINIFKSAFFAFALGLMIEFFLRLGASSRLIMINGIIVSIFVLIARHFFTAYYIKHKLKNRIKNNTVLLIQDAEDDSSVISRELLANVIKMTTEEALVMSHFEKYLKTKPIEKVIINSHKTTLNNFEPLVNLCSATGVEIWWHTDAFQQFESQVSIDYLGSTPLLVLHSSPRWQSSRVAKNIFDRCAAFFLLIISLPFILFASIGIMLTSPGPVFFRQQRSGLYGKGFSMWKLRTMRVDAPELLEKLKQEQGNDMDGPAFKLEHDPRIFGFGQLLRKTSIDELPQLINVLRGDMSLVGPRPLPTYEVEAFTESRHLRRLSVKPGITGLWQVEGRSNVVNFEDWIQLDLNYIDKWSLKLDLIILLKTIPAVLFSKGAK